MLPWVYEFRWTAGHVIFLCIFFSAVLVAASTVVLAYWRGRRDLASGKAGRILWSTEFEGLPEAARRCRHSFTGELAGRICPLAFDCRECAMHGKLLESHRETASAEPIEVPAGLQVSADRYYHRGHTWVQPLEGGFAMVGLDDLAQRLVGRPSGLEAPAPGTALTTNLPAWRIRRNGSEVTIPAPIDGTVVASVGDQPWTLKVKAAQPMNLRHLLHGKEVGAWLAAEVDRLQILASGSEGLAAMADGGVLMDDLSEALPADEWERICGEMLLEA